jgi:hypothetical protein
MLARERCHEDARHLVATNGMLVQSLATIDGSAATTAPGDYGALTNIGSHSPFGFLYGYHE